MDNKKRFLKKQLQDIIEEIGLSKNDKELKKSADKFNEVFIHASTNTVENIKQQNHN
jgi:vacuolar-type H+-ATPase subunit B/Vma2